MDVEEVVTTGQIDASNIDNQSFFTELTRLVEVRNPRFHGIAAIVIKALALDHLCRNRHVTGNRKIELVV